MIGTIFFGALGLAAAFWLLSILFRANKYEDGMDDWDAINYRRSMKTQGADDTNQQNPMYWGQMYHRYDLMQKAYDIEERRRGSDFKQTLAFIALLIVCVGGTYLLKHIGII
ncbi:MAG: hypothetical protein ACKVU0_16675 [Saprospiraceae bacterium]